MDTIDEANSAAVVDNIFIWMPEQAEYMTRL